MLQKAVVNIDIFKGLSRERVDELLAWFQKKSFKARQIIYTEGDQPEGLYILTKGAVLISKASSRGLFRLGEVRAPTFFGEVGFLVGAPHSVTVRAKTDVEAGLLPAIEFEEKLRQENITALKMSTNIARVLSSRLLAADEDIARFAAQELRNKTRTHIAKI